MAETMKNLNTRIKLKYDLLENWLSNDPVLLAGEIAIATVANNETNLAGTGFQNLPNVVMKVGDGTSKFSQLKYFSALAADVYEWAKSPNKPEYQASDIKGLEDFIAGEIQDSNTKYKIEQDTNNAHILRLYSQDLGATEWTMVSEITTADTVYDDTALAGRVTSLEGLVGSTKVETQIANAIAALNLGNTYETKGAAEQALAAAKTYADGKDATIKAAQDAADAAQDDVDALKLKVGTVADDKTVVGMIGENATAIGNVQTELTNYKTSNDAALAAEVKRAGDAEVALGERIDGVIEMVEGEAERADAAEKLNAAAAAAAQKTADDLAKFVGVLPEGETVETVVAYIDKKTADVTSGDEFTGLENRVKAIEEDYLVEADKTELSNAITAEKERAEGIEGGLRTDVNANIAAIEKLNGGVEVEGSVDKKIADAIAAENLAQYATDDDVAGLQTQINTILNNPDTEGVINSINEFTQYIADHGQIAEGFRSDIDALKSKVDTGDQTVTAYVGAAIEALKIGDYAKASELTALAARVAAMEAKVASWDAAEKNAKDYADGLNNAMNGRMEVVEGKAHEHANKDELDLIAAGDKAKWDTAAGKAHEHANADELAKIASGDVEKWNSAEKNAKDYADGLNTAMNGRMVAVEGKAHEHANSEVLGGITSEKVSAWDASEQNAKNYADGLIAGLDVTDAEVAHQVVTAVSETDGKIAVTRKQLTTDDIAIGVETWIFDCGSSVI